MLFSPAVIMPLSCLLLMSKAQMLLIGEWGGMGVKQNKRG